MGGYPLGGGSGAGAVPPEGGGRGTGPAELEPVSRCAGSFFGVDTDEYVGVETLATASSPEPALPERVLGVEARACWRTCRTGFGFVVAARERTLGSGRAGALWRADDAS